MKPGKSLIQTGRELSDAIRELKAAILKANECWMIPVIEWMTRRLK